MYNAYYRTDEILKNKNINNSDNSFKNRSNQCIFTITSICNPVNMFNTRHNFGDFMYVSLRNLNTRNPWGPDPPPQMRIS